MDPNSPQFQTFRENWQLSEAMITLSRKEALAEAVRILALQAAHFTRKYGETPLPDLNHLLSARAEDDESLGLLSDGAIALIGVLTRVAPPDQEYPAAPMH